MNDPTATPCTWVLDRLEAHLDQDLSAAQAQRLTAHLAACPACRAQEALARRVAAQLDALPALPCPEQVTAVAAGRVRRGRRSIWIARWRAWARPAWRPAFGLGLAGSLAVAAWTALSTPAPAYSPQQIAQAERQARFALASIGHVSRRAGFTVRDEVLQPHVVGPVERLTRATLEPEPM